MILLAKFIPSARNRRASLNGRVIYWEELTVGIYFSISNWMRSKSYSISAKKICVCSYSDTCTKIISYYHGSDLDLSLEIRSPNLCIEIIFAWWRESGVLINYGDSYSSEIDMDRKFILDFKKKDHPTHKIMINLYDELRRVDAAKFDL